MRTRRWGLTGAALAAVAFSACKKDPTADLAGKPAVLNVSPNLVLLKVGTNFTITVRVLDQTLTAIPATVQAASSASAVASVAASTGLPDPTGTSTAWTVRGVTAGSAVVLFTSSGLKDSAQVTVTP
jgi:hypothetical protein